MTLKPLNLCFPWFSIRDVASLLICLLYCLMYVLYVSCWFLVGKTFLQPQDLADVPWCFWQFDLVMEGPVMWLGPMVAPCFARYGIGWRGSCPPLQALRCRRQWKHRNRWAAQLAPLGLWTVVLQMSTRDIAFKSSTNPVVGHQFDLFNIMHIYIIHIYI